MTMLIIGRNENGQLMKVKPRATSDEHPPEHNDIVQVGRAYGRIHQESDGRLRLYFIEARHIPWLNGREPAPCDNVITGRPDYLRREDHRTVAELIKAGFDFEAGGTRD